MRPRKKSNFLLELAGSQPASSQQASQLAASKPARWVMLLEAANAADWNWGCGGRSPPPEKKVQTFCSVSEQP